MTNVLTARESQAMSAPAVPVDPTKFSLADITDVLWTVTDRCNLACPYCAVVPHGGPLPVEPTRADVDRILEQLARLPRLESLILSGGEALISSHIDYILGQASKVSRTRYLITNGTTLSPERKRILLNHRPRVMVSIDSLLPSENDRTRGPGTLKKATAAVDWLLAQGFYTVVIVVLTRENAGSIGTTLRRLYDRGVRNILIQQLHCTSSSLRSYFSAASPSLNQIQALAEFLREFRTDRPDVYVDDNEVCFFVKRPSEYARKCDPEREYVPQRLFMCGAGFNFFALKRNGDVIPCNALLECVAGNVHQTDLDTILERSPQMLGLRRLRRNRVDVISGCAACEFNPICDGGCRADVYNLTGEIGNPHPNCPVHHRWVPE